MRICFIPLFCFVLASCSCSSDKPNFLKEEIFSMLRSGTSDIEILVPESLSKPLVYCSDYMPPCKIGYKVKIKKMEVVGLYYEDQQEAYKSAKSMRGYHLRNWAFDNVAGEPVLEALFEKHLKAQKVQIDN